MSQIMIKTDENDLIKLISIYVKDDNMRKLVYDLIHDSSPAVEWAFKFHLGHMYPKVPKVGDVGYINLETYSGWSGNVDKYKNSQYVQQGYLKVTVHVCKSLRHYHPLIVHAPEHEENGKQWAKEFQLPYGEFILEDDLDIDSLF